MEDALVLEKVSKKYKNSDFELKDISFSVPYGSVVGFVGENGAGKSTTMNCILNTTKADSGKIRIFGKEMTDEDVEIRGNIGVVYDGDNFPLHLSAEKLDVLFKGFYKNWDSGIFREYLDRFSLSKDKVLRDYSRGMGMKLAIAVALSHKAKLLILDEATGGLDPIMREEVLNVLLEFVQDEAHSILLSSHITSDLECIADYIVFIHDGKIILKEEKDKLIYEYGILCCSDDEFNMIDKMDILKFRKKDYQIDILVTNKEEIQKKYKDMVVDSANIDEIMLLLMKGEGNESFM